MLPELEALNRLRLRREWTWEQLGQAMRRAHVPVPYRTLHYLLTNPDVKPHDKTRGRVRRFLKSAVARRHPRPRRRPTTPPEVTL